MAYTPSRGGRREKTVENRRHGSNSWLTEILIHEQLHASSEHWLPPTDYLAVSRRSKGCEDTTYPDYSGVEREIEINLSTVYMAQGGGGGGVSQKTTAHPSFSARSKNKCAYIDVCTSSIHTHIHLYIFSTKCCKSPLTTRHIIHTHTCIFSPKNK